MQNRLTQMRNQLLLQIIGLDDQQPELGSAVITFFLIQTQLLNLAYLPLNQYGYLQIVYGFCRPQALIEIGDTSPISILLFMIYITYIIFPIKGRRVISLIGIIVETPIFNFFIETAKYPQSYLLLVLLIIIQLSRMIIIDGQLDIDIINFQYIKQSWINRVIKLLRFIQILNFQSFKNFQLLISTTIAMSYIIRNLREQQPLQYIKISIQINIITLYYSFLVALNFDQQFNTEIIIIPFLLRISASIVQRMAYKSSYNLNDIFTLIIQQQNAILKKKHQLNHLTIEQAINKLISKDPLRRKNYNFEDGIIYASCLMKFDKKFDALKYILQLKEFKQPIITSLKLNRLQTKCLKQIFRKMEQKQIIVGKMVKDLMYAEHQNYNLYHQIIGLIVNKIAFLKQLDQQKINKQQILEMNRQIIQLYDALNLYHERTQSHKSQSILIFYQCEILNDLIEPFLKKNQMMKQTGFENFLSGQFLTNKMIYLITEYQENLIIKRHSNNIQDILQKQDIINEKVDLFLPIAVQNVHKQLVEQMFDDGHSKFMRNLTDNILKLPNGFLITIEFALDVLFIKDTLQFVVFIQQSINQPMKMAADNEFIINHISDNICLYIQPYQLLGKSLLDIIPNFKQTIENEDYSVFNQVEILKYKYLAQLSVYTKRLQQNPVYFIIQIISIRSIVNLDETSFIIQQQNDNLDEEVEIMSPIIFSNDNEIPLFTQRITSPKSTFIVPFIQNYEQNFFVTKQKLDSDLTSDQQKNNQKQIQDYKKTTTSSKNNIYQSTYFKKYELVLKSSLLQGFSKLHQILLALFLLLLATQQSIQISQYITVNESMKSIISDVEMLQIKNLIFQPLEAFLLTRWNILQYNNLYQLGVINQTYLQNLLIFPYSNLILGYDDLSYNIKNSQNYKGLAKYYDGIIINISLYNSTNQGQIYHFSLRECLEILLNYQYIIKKRYQIEGSVVLDSPYVYFTYKNLITLNNAFTDINNEIYENSIHKSQILIDFVTTLLIIILAFLAIFSLMIGYFYIKIEKKSHQYLSLLYNVERDQIIQEINRLQGLHRVLIQNNDSIFTFQYNIDNLEQRFQIQSQTYQKIKKKETNQKKSYINSISVGLFLTYCFIICYTIFCNYYAKLFLNQYPQTAKLYMRYSIVGTDIPTIYAMREVLYNRNLFPFYKDQQVQEIQDQISASLDSIREFTNIKYSKDQLIMSDQFYDYLLNINAQNLCQYFEEQLNDQSYSLCMNSMDGTIYRGLRELLVYIYNSINNEKLINNFTSRTQQFQIGELEGAFIASHLIKIINHNFNLDIMQQTNNQNNLAQTLMLIFTLLLFVFQVYFILSIKFIHQREYYLFQRIIYLIPRNVILFDDAFERNLRSLFTQETILKH